MNKFEFILGSLDSRLFCASELKTVLVCSLDAAFFTKELLGRIRERWNFSNDPFFALDMRRAAGLEKLKSISV
jgi:hypothetical protein